MSGYTHTWRCRMCHEQQTTIDNPKVPVCDKCERPLAVVLCKNELGVDLNAKGVDQQYWMNRAHEYVTVLMRRWVSIQQRGVPIEQMGMPEITRHERGPVCST